MRDLIAFVKKHGLEVALRYDAAGAPQDRWACDITVPASEIGAWTTVQGFGPSAPTAIRRALQVAGESIQETA